MIQMPPECHGHGVGSGSAAGKLVVKKGVLHLSRDVPHLSGSVVYAPTVVSTSLDSLILHMLWKQGKAPAALIVDHASSALVSAVLRTGMPMVVDPHPQIPSVFREGDRVEVNALAGTIRKL